MVAVSVERALGSIEKLSSAFRRVAQLARRSTRALRVSSIISHTAPSLYYLC